MKLVNKNGNIIEVSKNQGERLLLKGEAQKLSLKQKICLLFNK